MKKKSIDFSLALKRFRSGKCPVCGDKLHYSQERITGMYCRSCDAHWLVDGDITLDIKDGNDEEVELVNDLKGIEHVPEILQAVLSLKKMLPVLIGIDDRFDALIAERLK